MSGVVVVVVVVVDVVVVVVVVERVVVVARGYDLSADPRIPENCVVSFAFTDEDGSLYGSLHGWKKMTSSGMWNRLQGNVLLSFVFRFSRLEKGGLRGSCPFPHGLYP